MDSIEYTIKIDYETTERGEFMNEMTVAATLEHIKPVMDFVNAKLKELGCSERNRIQLDVAVDELFGNIARYAYQPGIGEATVRLDVEKDPLCVIITFIDRGVPYDPLKAEFVDTTHLPANERPIGGLGLFMVKRIMDNVSYNYRDGQNILTIRKKI